MYLRNFCHSLNAEFNYLRRVQYIGSTKIVPHTVHWTVYMYNVQYIQTVFNSITCKLILNHLQTTNTI